MYRFAYAITLTITSFIFQYVVNPEYSAYVEVQIHGGIFLQDQHIHPDSAGAQPFLFPDINFLAVLPEKQFQSADETGMVSGIYGSLPICITMLPYIVHCVCHLKQRPSSSYILSYPAVTIHEKWTAFMIAQRIQQRCPHSGGKNMFGPEKCLSVHLGSFDLMGHLTSGVK